MTNDPRENYGILVEQKIKGPYALIPSRHTSPDTGGLLDYGISAQTLDGNTVVIGELFARAPSKSGEPVRLNTILIGQHIVDTLNKAEGEPNDKS